MATNIAQNRLPQQSIDRLCLLFGHLEMLEREGRTRATSSELGRDLGIAPHSIRKDISLLGEAGRPGNAYDTFRLRRSIGDRLGIDSNRKACVVGLGRLGMSILDYPNPVFPGSVIVAGFDSNVNLLETIRTSVPVYPAYEMADIVKREEIEIAILTVPASAAQKATDRLTQGGIAGILNFTPAAIRPSRDNVLVRNIDMTGEFRILSATLKFQQETQ